MSDSQPHAARPKNGNPIDEHPKTKVTAEQFGNAVIKAGLSSAEELKAIWSSLPAAQRPRDGEAFSKLLVTLGQLTKLQAGRLISGHGSSLVLGDYVLLDVIGAGGMGEVYKAMHRRMKRLVAIKLLPTALNKDTAAIKRFEREVEAAAKLTHPNIVVAYDAGRAKGEHFLVMEYVDGIDLSSHVRRHGPLPVVQALNCILQVAHGLQYAHELGVVHRDIKPANLLLDRKGTVKVLDMGLARLATTAPGADELTGTGQIMGTVDYMAPEQAMQTKDVDGRADIYSLGITLWFLLTGRPTYERESLMAKLMAHQQDPIPLLSAACPTVPRTLDATFARMIAKSPEGRYQTMNQVIAALEACRRDIAVPEPATALGASNPDEIATLCPSVSATAVGEGLETTLDHLHPTPFGGMPHGLELPQVVALPQGVAGEDTLANIPHATDTNPNAQRSHVSTPIIVAKSRKKPGALPRIAWRNRFTMLAVAGGASLVVLVAILITMMNNGGSDTHTTVTPGTTAEVKTAPLPNAKTSQGEVPSVPATAVNSDAIARASAPARVPNTAESVSTPDSEQMVDFASERKAAEWVLGMGGTLELVDADGVQIPLVAGKLPAVPFAIQVVALQNRNVHDEDMTKLSGCRRLTGLFLEENSITGEGLAFLKRVPSLQSLVFSTQRNLSGEPRQATNSGLVSVSSLIQLRELSLKGNMALTDECLHHVSQLAGLEVLELNDVPITDKGLDLLTPLQRLKRCRLYGISGVTSTGIKRFVQAHPLVENLDITGTSCKIADLRGMTQLNSISADSTQFDSSAVGALQGMTHLQHLLLFSPDQAALEAASQLPQLRYLNCYGFGVPAESRKAALQLLNSSAIRQLNWTQVQLEDNDLLQLAAVSKLEELGIDSSEITQDGIDKFRLQRPDVELLIKGNRFPRTAEPGTVAIPRALEVAAIKPAAAARKPPALTTALIPQLAAASEEQSNSHTPLPVDPGLARKWKPGTPISARALVGNPAPIRELASWSVEPISHLAYAQRVRVSPDGKRIATSGLTDASVRIWRMPIGDHESSAPLERVLLGESGGIWDSIWSPSGQLLATVNSGQKQVALYDALNGRRLTSFDLLHGGAQMLAWSPNGSRLAVPSWGLVIIDIATRKLRTSSKLASFVAGCWSPDGRGIVTLEENGTVAFWNPETLEIISETPMPTLIQDAAIDWSPDGKWIAIGGKSGRVTLWDPSTRRMLKDKVTNPTATWVNFAWEPAPPKGLAGHPRWPRLLMTSGSMSEIWDSELRERLAIFESAVGQCFGVWTPDGTRVVTTNLTYPVPHVFDASTGEPVTNAQFPTPEYKGTFSVSTDGKTLRALYRNELLIFNAETGEYLKKFGNVIGTQVSTSPKDDWVAVYDPDSEDHPLVLLDTATYEKRISLAGQQGKVTAVNWSVDNQFLASCDSSGRIRIWKALDQSLVKEIQTQRPVKCVVWSRDGKQLVSCGDDEVIRVWDVASGTQKTQSEQLTTPAATGATAIAWCPTADVIAIAPRSAQAILLDLKTGKLSDPIISLGAGLVSVVWSPDGKQLLAGNGQNGGEIGYRAVRSPSATTAHGHGVPIQWMPDNRRVVTGQYVSAAVQAVDTRKGARLGALLPRMVDGGWLCIGADGHFRGSEGIESQLVYVALHKDGSQTTHSPADFASRFGWKNDPNKATFLKLRDSRP